MYTTKYIHIFKTNGPNILTLNTLTGAIDLIDKKIFDLLVTNKQKEIPRDIITKLRERKYLYETEDEEINFLNNLINQLAQTENCFPKAPYFYLCLTYNCNLRCIYCNESDYVYPGNEIIMTPELIDKALTTILSLTNTETLKKRPIILYGGEPFMESTYKIVEFTFKRIRSLQLPLVIITNGTKINLFHDILCAFNQNSLTFVITLDGPKEIHDMRRPSMEGWSSYEAIVKNIEWILESGFKLELQCILDMQNIAYLSEFCNLIITKKWHLYPNCRFFIGRTMFINSKYNYRYTLSEADFVKLLFEQIHKNHNIKEIFKKFTGGFQISAYLDSIFSSGHPPLPKITGCRACNPGLYVFCPDGFIYPCLKLINLENFAIGKFYPKLVWNDIQLNRWRNYKITNNLKCKCCKFLLICQGGCPARQFMGIHKCPNIPDVVDAYLKCRFASKFESFLFNNGERDKVGE